MDCTGDHPRPSDPLIHKPLSALPRLIGYSYIVTEVENQLSILCYPHCVKGGTSFLMDAPWKCHGAAPWLQAMPHRPLLNFVVSLHRMIKPLIWPNSRGWIRPNLDVQNHDHPELADVAFPRSPLCTLRCLTYLCLLAFFPSDNCRVTKYLSRRRSISDTAAITSPILSRTTDRPRLHSAHHSHHPSRGIHPSSGP